MPQIFNDAKAGKRRYEEIPDDRRRINDQMDIYQQDYDRYKNGKAGSDQ